MDTLSANSPCSFRPTINRRSRRLTSGLLSVQERQQFDLARRETRHRELVAKVEAERQLTETFKPTTNRQIRSGSRHSSSFEKSSEMGIDRPQTALIRKTNINNPEETFHPVINTKSERIATANGSLQNNLKHTQEVRQRVQGLWREFADIGSGEMTLSGVHCVLKELGLNASSPMVEKFLQALGINESLGIRCVPYDRFMKVFTVVLRAALVTPSQGECNHNNNNSNNNNRVKHSELISSEDEYVQRQSSVRSHDSAPTMRRAHSTRSSTPKRSTVNSNHTIPKKSIMVSRQSVDIQETNMGLSHYKENTHDTNNINNNSENNSNNSNDDSNSPLPVAPHETMGLKDNKNISKRISERSQGLSSSMHQQDSEKRIKKTTYDPLNGCTFAPVINKNYRPHASSKHGNGSEVDASSTSHKTPTTTTTTTTTTAVVYKTREEKEMEECTFAPNTARYHKNRDSLAWWTREPFIETNSETTSRNVVNENEASLECLSSKDKMDYEETLTNNAYSKSLQKPVVKEQQEGRLRTLSARSAPIAMGFDKAVKRMIEARKKSRPKFEEMLRTSEVETQKLLKPTVVEPFTLQAQSRYLEREQQKPVLYVDVDLPSGKTGRIGVHRGDKAEDLAKGFSQAYQLGNELRERLECVLREKLNELLRENVQTLWL